MSTPKMMMLRSLKVHIADEVLISKRTSSHKLLVFVDGYNSQFSMDTIDDLKKYLHSKYLSKKEDVSSIVLSVDGFQLCTFEPISILSGDEVLCITKIDAKRTPMKASMTTPDKHIIAPLLTGKEGVSSASKSASKRKRPTSPVCLVPSTHPTPKKGGKDSYGKILEGVSGSNGKKPKSSADSNSKGKGGKKGSGHESLGGGGSDEEGISTGTRSNTSTRSSEKKDRHRRKSGSSSSRVCIGSGVGADGDVSSRTKASKRKAVVLCSDSSSSDDSSSDSSSSDGATGTNMVQRHTQRVHEVTPSRLPLGGTGTVKASDDKTKPETWSSQQVASPQDSSAVMDASTLWQLLSSKQAHTPAACIMKKKVTKVAGGVSSGDASRGRGRGRNKASEAKAEEGECVDLGATGGPHASIATASLTVAGMRMHTPSGATGGDGVLKGGAGVLKGGAGVLKGGDGVLKGGAGVLKGGAGVLKGGAGVLKGGGLPSPDNTTTECNATANANATRKQTVYKHSGGNVSKANSLTHTLLHLQQEQLCKKSVVTSKHSDLKGNRVVVYDVNAQQATDKYNSQQKKEVKVKKGVDGNRSGIAGVDGCVEGVGPYTAPIVPTAKAPSTICPNLNPNPSASAASAIASTGGKGHPVEAVSWLEGTCTGTGAVNTHERVDNYNCNDNGIGNCCSFGYVGTGAGHRVAVLNLRDLKGFDKVEFQYVRLPTEPPYLPTVSHTYQGVVVETIGDTLTVDLSICRTCHRNAITFEDQCTTGNSTHKHTHKQNPSLTAKDEHAHVADNYHVLQVLVEDIADKAVTSCASTVGVVRTTVRAVFDWNSMVNVTREADPDQNILAEETESSVDLSEDITNMLAGKRRILASNAADAHTTNTSKMHMGLDINTQLTKQLKHPVDTCDGTAAEAADEVDGELNGDIILLLKQKRQSLLN